MEVLSLRVGYIQTNCYIAFDDDSREGVIVDPGDEALKIIQKLQNEKITPKAILLTHGHLDHMLAADELRKHYQIPIYAHEKEKAVLLDPEANLTASWMNLPMTLEADIYVRDGEEFHLAGFDWKAIHTPGHTIGGVCYYAKKEKKIFVGDTLFEGSFGRYDLLTASPSMLMESLNEKLFILPDDVKAYPGHGGTTMIGVEKKTNPAVGYKK
ncbi:Hydroxyacylglutathione hydrolase [Lachnospiraceae bacterium TWA4]|nr:Hydroxyacylglutathione hydrolase [Lachnospiraceae bacterium TWA4]